MFEWPHEGPVAVVVAVAGVESAATVAASAATRLVA